LPANATPRNACSTALSFFARKLRSYRVGS